MKAKTVLFSTVLALTGGFGCGTRPFVRTDPPVSANDVTVALVGQRCMREASNEVYDVLNLEMVVRVTNSSAAPVEVNPANMRLIARASSLEPARSTEPSAEGSAVELAPHTSVDVHVRFQRPGNAKCDQEMQLSFEHSIEISGRNLAARPLSFVPERSDT